MQGYPTIGGFVVTGTGTVVGTTPAADGGVGGR